MAGHRDSRARDSGRARKGSDGGADRTEHGSEVDFVVEIGREVWAIELKASRNVVPVALRGLRAFADFHAKRHQALVLYMGDDARQTDGIDGLPCQQGLKTMGL